MPTSARKSSVGVGRRGPPKAHIPYRGDNPNVGKKTGIAVAHVERKSDGFEPFGELIRQADGRAPPKPKKKVVREEYDDDDEEDEDEYDDDEDEFGEMSMQLDSPVQNLASVRPPTTPTNGRSNSRPVARTSSVDFDKIPSPHSRSMRQTGPGPSKLRRSVIHEEREPSSEPHEQYEEDSGGMDGDSGGGGGNLGFDDDIDMGNNYDDSPPPDSNDANPRRTSFTHLDQDDDDDDDEEPEPISKKQKGKGKARQQDHYDDEDVEDDIARELNELDNAPPSDDGAEDEVPEPPQRKKIKVQETRPVRTKTQSINKKENRDSREGVRRSSRAHHAPLEWWRGERYVYGKPEYNQTVLVPHIREIVRIPKEEPLHLANKRKRGRSRSRTVQPQAVQQDAAGDPEDGWDDATVPNAKVLDYRTSAEVDKRIAWTAQMVNPKKVPNGDWAYEKILWDTDFIAAGQLVIPPKCRKPSKGTKDNTYIFYVIEGAVNLKIHDTSLVLAPGGMFMVPRGNTYFIENISHRDAKLFFTQARKMMNDDEERAVAINNQQKRKARRSSSAGPVARERAAEERATSAIDSEQVNGDVTPKPRAASKAKAKA
ncbi:hypothetical protein FA15DRAFT_670483 [Coprinopsis marcescibilis]|uniref:CENP-C homolog n=1 Tax=Coprinopsis marcescibilis TaxID=230819 RepID=A0A5C3KUE5_COPMA|nr:hypothetical protein FA15DRAFT_670483 [Coprinopsis marcescibilis]